MRVNDWQHHHLESLIPACRLALDAFLTNHPEIGAECLLGARYWSRRERSVKAFTTHMLMTLTTEVITPLYKEVLGRNGDIDDVNDIGGGISPVKVSDVILRSRATSVTESLAAGSLPSEPPSPEPIKPTERRNQGITARDAHIVVGTSAIWFMLMLAHTLMQ